MLLRLLLVLVPSRLQRWMLLLRVLLVLWLELGRLTVYLCGVRLSGEAKRIRVELGRRPSLRLRLLLLRWWWWWRMLWWWLLLL